MRKHPPGVLAATVGVFHQSTQSIAPGLNTGERRLVGWVIFTGLKIQRFFHLFAVGTVEAIKAAFTFASGRALRNHLFDKGAGPVDVAIHVDLGKCCQHRTFHVWLQVYADKIQQAEYPGLGNAHGLADYRVGFFDSEAVLKSKAHGNPHPQDANSVGNKTRSILAVHYRFTQHAITKIPQGGDNLRTGIRSSDQLQQPHVTWWIKEVSHSKMLAKILAHAFDKMGERNG